MSHSCPLDILGIPLKLNSKKRRFSIISQSIAPKIKSKSQQNTDIACG
jgi:hypothetical protein